jgi:hypothetical protein
MTIRTLQQDEPIPNAPVRRYKNASGYVRLRWHVGPEEYIEEYEHRIVAGRPGPDLQVHHLNRIRDDNRPGNLVVLTLVEHAELHAQENRPAWDRALANRHGYRSNVAWEKARRSAERRANNLSRYREMRRLYESGMTTIEIGSLFHVDSSNVSRHLRQVGTKMRAFSRWHQ